MKKKLITVLCIIAMMAFTLAGCGGSADKSDSSASGSQDQAASSEAADSGESTSEEDEFAAFIELFKNPPKDDGSAIMADKFPEEYNPVQTDTEDGYFMTTISKEEGANTHVFFLHGGAAVLGGNEFHVNTMCELADRGLRVTIFHYPLAPDNDYKVSNQSVYDAYKQLVAAYPDDTFVLWGDSAGVTFGLNLQVKLRDEGDKSLPTKAAWVSPCINWDTNNPEVQKKAETDPTLAWEVISLSAPKYAPDENYTDPEVSPFYADLSNLGEIYCTYSTEEMFEPDDVKFVEKIEETEGTEITKLNVCEGLYHDYVIQTEAEPKAMEAIEEIAEFYKN